MLRNLKLLSLLLVLSLLGAIQFVIYQRVQNVAAKVSHHGVIVKDFIQIVSKHLRQVVLIDPIRPASFQELIETHSEFISFLVFSTHFHEKKTLLNKELQAAGFTITEYDANEDECQIVKSLNCTSAVAYQHESMGKFLQLLVAYQTQTNYWTLSSKTNNSIFLKSHRTHRVPAYAIIYDKFNLSKIPQRDLILYKPSNISSFINHGEQSRFVACDFSRAQAAYQQLSTDQRVIRKEFGKKVHRMLLLIQMVLNDLHIPFWISSGTLFGYFRECYVLPHAEVGIGIFIKDYKPEMKKAFEKQGFHLKHHFGFINDSLELSFQKSEMKLDISFFYRNTTVRSHFYWNGGTQAKTGNKYIYIFQPFTLCWTEFLQLKLRIPCQTERYITAYYGPEWMVPVNEWDWKTSPENVRPNGRWAPDLWPQVIQVYN